LTDCIAVAERAQLVSSQARSAQAECFLTLVLRDALYRSGASLQPDLELVEAASRLNIVDIEAIVVATEGAIAWRQGQSEIARRLIQRARTLWSAIGWDRGATFMRAILIDLDRDAESTEISEMADFATRDAPPGVGLQILALLSRSIPALPEGWIEHARRLAASLRETPTGGRLEVLGPEECIAMLAAHEASRGSE
jgi:hypothetical protein